MTVAPLVLDRDGSPDAVEAMDSVRVRLPSGSAARLPRDLVKAPADGSYRAGLVFTDLDPGGQTMLREIGERVSRPDAYSRTGRVVGRT